MKWFKKIFKKKAYATNDKSTPTQLSSTMPQSPSQRRLLLLKKGWHSGSPFARVRYFPNEYFRRRN